MKKLLIIILTLCFITGCTGRPKEAEVISSEIDHDKEHVKFDVYAEEGISTYSVMKMMAEDHESTYNTGKTTEELSELIGSEDGEVFFIDYELAKKHEKELEIVSINAMNNLYMVHNGITFETVRQFSDKKIYMLDRTTDRKLLETAMEHYDLDDGTDVEYLSSYREIYEKVMATEDCVAIIQQPYVSLLQHRNENVEIVMDMLDVWKEEGNQSNIITDCIAVRRNVLENRGKELERYLEVLYGYSNFMYKDAAGYMELVRKYDPDNYIDDMEKEVSSLGFAFIKGNILKEAIDLFEKDLK